MICFINIFTNSSALRPKLDSGFRVKQKSSFVLPLILNSKILDGATVHPPSSPTSARPRELEWGQKLSWTIFEKGAKEDWEDVGQERENLG